KADPWELFNLGLDRTETSNLASRHPEIVEQLAQRWEHTLASLVEAASKGDDP
ncbi:MAG: hypothetical protein GWO24_34740, partial [Akkermansiaceae bacterium]|nr:hypothetical protein [Akkermansiaceae bacterium]